MVVSLQLPKKVNPIHEITPSGTKKDLVRVISWILFSAFYDTESEG